MQSEQRAATVKVVVATTVMLSFISFWRAAAIVLSDLASSAYYVGGIAETAVGKSAPWFILAIMLFSYRGARHLHRELLDVRARRRVQSGPRGHGRDAGQVLRLRPDVRLRAHRPDLRRQRRAVPGRPDQRDRREPAPARTARLPALFRRGLRRRRHHLLLAQEHHRAFTNPARRRCASCRSPP